jgi:hypothetical protein
MTDHFTFANSNAGLLHAFEIALSLRRFGFKTRLATRRLFTFPTGEAGFVHTVVATPPTRPTRTERGCNLEPEAPYITQAREIAKMYNELAEAERRPDLEE